MENSPNFLQDARDSLNQVIRPFQQELNRKQRMADFVKQCIGCTDQDDFLQLDELLRSKTAETVEQEQELSLCRPVFSLLRVYADKQAERYRLRFAEDIRKLAEEAGLPIRVDFPDFSILKGIEGTVNFSKRFTAINKKILKSVDPRRIIRAVLKIKCQMYDGPYNPQAFVDSLCKIYTEIIRRENRASGDTVPIRQFYIEYMMSLQSRSFFQTMEKAKFREYTPDQFAVDIWRYFQSDIKAASDGCVLQLRPGRNNSLWLIDSDGERRQITGISFQEKENDSKEATGTAQAF